MNESRRRFVKKRLSAPDPTLPVLIPSDFLNETKW